MPFASLMTLQFQIQKTCNFMPKTSVSVRAYIAIDPAPQNSIAKEGKVEKMKQRFIQIGSALVFAIMCVSLATEAMAETADGAIQSTKTSDIRKARQYEEGDKCTASTELPPHLTCFDREVYDCTPNNKGEMGSGGGRMGYIACASAIHENYKNELNRHYRALLKHLQRPLENDMDFAAVRAALVKSQNAWEISSGAECEIEESLLGPGNAQAAITLDCLNADIKSRIEYLKSLEERLP